ncbi:Ribosomal protein S18 acetylase RimI [Paenibacillus tianmuensis]|uniref:Ribosomal protein S18 acetylase RimI n=1 Tax=Paenibacillus tianmuensis TaxID=624147 RepID=A0A1G4TZ49_9BACL|nr:GNAT family N-acetyltransferase [Paenibacillus tianmuensis]SCW86631.1 Ribosomal protein S18 acetylase RimI [Paenibacillus tianmuensis]
MELNVKRLSECTLNQAVEVWNKGFEDYYVQIVMTVDAFLARMVAEGLSPDYSFVAFDGDEPVGIILNGIRTISSAKTAWNGGTAVAASHRRHGVARQLLEASIQLYREEGVSRATLEAFKQNEKAIALYQQMGYEVTDQLVVLESSEAWHPGELPRGDYTVRWSGPHEAARLPFYDANSAWQTGWQSLKDGHAVIASDPQGHPVGYALAKRVYDALGEHTSTFLYQCVTSPDAPGTDGIVRLLCSEVFAGADALRKRALNLPGTSVCAEALTVGGFTVAVEQVKMDKSF